MKRGVPSDYEEQLIPLETAFHLNSNTKVNVQDHWTLTAPPGKLCDSHPKESGWMSSDNFANFLKCFVKYANPSVQCPVLMVLDNHASHCSESAINFCQEGHISRLSFLLRHFL
ncbi:unnamed protein product [Lepeophtheirus salmonis]|uniref:(salmon louse) hypothetical protein n=1 Tax=Lepeophtheirus salmonis TaxID=72036 RepID=A0A7R8CWQ7_LEPSM|nr:unnamed protein product [Lepeophtheirus salmonis]CAF2954336.1 unnamed protein product [Lepeophtheirus salmonis]